MNLKILAAIALIPFAIQSPALAQFVDGCGVSFVILPGGECLDLSYATVLGASRRNVAETEAIYQSLFNANVTLETIYSQYPLLDNETEAEREARITSLVESGQIRDAVVSSGGRVEDRLFPLHNRAMTIMGESFR